MPVLSAAYPYTPPLQVLSTGRVQRRAVSIAAVGQPQIAIVAPASWQQPLGQQVSAGPPLVASTKANKKKKNNKKKVSLLLFATPESRL